MATRFLRLCLPVLCLVLSACADARYGIASVKLRFDSPIERRASLSALKHAWEDRPDEICPEGNLYERSLLNRAAYFGRKVKGTETYQPACDFWMRCVREHIARYEEDAHRFRN